MEAGWGFGGGSAAGASGSGFEGNLLVRGVGADVVESGSLNVTFFEDGFSRSVAGSLGFGGSKSD